jgi:uncharacterized repeat protein (TIGR04138 family)
MKEVDFELKLEKILAKDPRYTRDGYIFVREALDFTQQLIARESQGIRHVSGQELLDGIRQYALKQFGPMATTVLEEWGIKSCPDFGEIVFNMVEADLLAKTEKDTRKDFENGYDFVTAFRKPYLPQGKAQPETRPIAKID